MHECTHARGLQRNHPLLLSVLPSPLPVSVHSATQFREEFYNCHEPWHLGGFARKLAARDILTPHASALPFASRPPLFQYLFCTDLQSPFQLQQMLTKDDVYHYSHSVTFPPKSGHFISCIFKLARYPPFISQPAIIAKLANSNFALCHYFTDGGRRVRFAPTVASDAVDNGSCMAYPYVYRVALGPPPGPCVAPGARGHFAPCAIRHSTCYRFETGCAQPGNTRDGYGLPGSTRTLIGSTRRPPLRKRPWRVHASCPGIRHNVSQHRDFYRSQIPIES